MARYEEHKLSMTQPADPAGNPQAPPNRMGTAAAIAGIVSIPLAVLIAPAGLAAGVLGLVLGLVARSRARKGTAASSQAVIIGTVTGAIGTVIAAVFLVIVATFLSSHASQLSKLNACVKAAKTSTQRSACQSKFAKSLG
ncbi:MAG: hypothetical protein ACYDH5_09450 [Acidimicrobiales bacterium]